ncbi:MAG: twin-arginine translocase TatA/TatE family subunit [Verrucomicrobia bacterium]|nr:twin-arginine translocase TatA/TatE family subunit [Verrucomicrobiota bacterium]MBU1910542.1 twin-arginine translocase TatA/TatE family subunit [Verrucomicrobiota bacterium]
MAFLPGGTPGGGELILIFVVALVLFGAKRLPGLARSLGRAIEEFRRAARDVSEEIHRAADASSPPSETPKPLEKESDHERVG